MQTTFRNCIISMKFRSRQYSCFYIYTQKSIFMWPRNFHNNKIVIYVYICIYNIYVYTIDQEMYIHTRFLYMMRPIIIVLSPWPASAGRTAPGPRVGIREAAAQPPRERIRSATLTAAHSLNDWWESWEAFKPPVPARAVLSAKSALPRRSTKRYNAYFEMASAEEVPHTVHDVYKLLV